MMTNSLPEIFKKKKPMKPVILAKNLKIITECMT